MSFDGSLPVTVFVVGLGERQRERLMPLFSPAGSTVTVMSDLSAEALSGADVPDLLIIGARTDTDAVAEDVRHARRRWASATIIPLSIKSAEEAIALLEAGADDVGMAETTWEIVPALISAALRRARIANEQLRIRFGDLVYDRESRRVWCAGREVQFTPREFRLFDILFQRAGQPVSADTLEGFVWNDTPPKTSNSLAVYIGYLRRKLAGSRISMLETMRGSGYRLARRAE